mgnify:CR=1 FL=1|tara:strand:- start:2722 stop:2946 length:225 start_codon:yes stop_codon:yes gene_type:complete
MQLTTAQKKTIGRLEKASAKELGQWVGEPRVHDLFTIHPMGGEPVRVEVCYGWSTIEWLIHPDGRREELNEYPA